MVETRNSLIKRRPQAGHPGYLFFYQKSQGNEQQKIDI
jgi:hypothetical protein